MVPSRREEASPMTPDPPDAELEEINDAQLAKYNTVWGVASGLKRGRAQAVHRLVDNLVICRQQSTAKAAVVEDAREVLYIFGLGPLEFASAYGPDLDQREEETRRLTNLSNTLAALDNLPSVAKQGETDDGDA